MAKATKPPINRSLGASMKRLKTPPQSLAHELPAAREWVPERERVILGGVPMRCPFKVVRPGHFRRSRHPIARSLGAQAWRLEVELPTRGFVRSSVVYVVVTKKDRRTSALSLAAVALLSARRPREPAAGRAPEPLCVVLPALFV